MRQRVPMSSEGVQFNNEVAYVMMHSHRGSFRVIDLAAGDGNWHTVQQYEASQLAYDNHSSMVSLTMSELGEEENLQGSSLSLTDIAEHKEEKMASDNINQNGGDGGGVGSSMFSEKFELAMKNATPRSAKEEITDEATEATKKAASCVFKSANNTLVKKQAAKALAKYVGLYLLMISCITSLPLFPHLTDIVLYPQTERSL